MRQGFWDCSVTMADTWFTLLAVSIVVGDYPARRIGDGGKDVVLVVRVLGRIGDTVYGL